MSGCSWFATGFGKRVGVTYVGSGVDAGLKVATCRLDLTPRVQRRLHTLRILGVSGAPTTDAYYVLKNLHYEDFGARKAIDS